jgi:hypothetical protein
MFTDLFIKEIRFLLFKQLLAEPPTSNEVLKRYLGDSPILPREELDKLLEGGKRFALVNLWRNIDRDKTVIDWYKENNSQS